MKSFKISVKLFTFFTGLLTLTWLFFNIFSSTPVTLEQTFHTIKNLFFIDTLNSVIFSLFIFLLIVILFYLFDKIFSLFISLIKNYNPFVLKLKTFQKEFDEYKYYDLLDHIEDFNLTWLFFNTYRIDCKLLKAKALLNVGELDKFGKLVFELNPNTLNIDQNISYQKLKLQLFLLNGYIVGARNLLEEVTTSGLIHKKDISLILISSTIKEISGDLDGARQFLLAAIKDFDSLKPVDLIPLYNNLGRISGIFGNDTIKLNYYEKSKDLIVKYNFKNQIHIVFPNLISTLLLNSQIERAKVVFEQYSAIVDHNNLYDVFNYYNYKLEYYRQLDDSQSLDLTVRYGEYKLRENLSEDMQLSFDISTLRIKYNGNLNYLETLSKIQNNWVKYCNLDFLDKLSAFKEIYIVFSMDNSHQSDKSFCSLRTELYNFLKKEAPTLIDSYIKNEIKPYEIYLQKNLLNDKIEFSRLTPVPFSFIFNSINSIIKLMTEIADLLESNGNLLEAYVQYLNIIDESIHSLKNPLSNNEKDFIFNNSKILFHEVYSKLSNFYNHPALPEFLIRLSWFALQLNERSIASKLFFEFKDLNVSINHYSNYMKNYCGEVQNEFL